MSYKEELKFVADAPDDIFPDFLFSSMYNNFDDHFYQNSLAEDEIKSEIKGLRRKYANFFDWSDAVQIYNEYMEYLINKYGGKRVIKNSVELGLVSDPLPAKPKLKNKRRNKEFLRANIVPSRQVIKVVPDEEYLEAARCQMPNAFGQDINENDRFNKLPKREEKRIAQIKERIAGSERRHNLYRSNGISYGTDFIIEYLNQSTKGYYDEHGDHKIESILDIIDEDNKYKNIPQELIDDEFGNDTNIINGRMVNRKDIEMLDIMKELYDKGGLDVLGTFGKNMDKKAVKMVRASIGSNEPLTKKELKRAKRQARHDRDKLEQRRDNDKLLEQTLLGNKFEFESKDHNLSFRLKDIYRDD